MAELGAISGAIGIASFAIQVCQGLLGYYRDYRDHPKDAAAAVLSIQDLSDIFERLDDTASSASLTPEQDEILENCLGRCKDGVQRLENEWKEIRKHDATATGTRQAIKRAASRVMYPFKKDTVDKLQNLVDELVSRLATALAVFDFDLSSKTSIAVSHVKDRVAEIQASTDRIVKGIQSIQIDTTATAVNIGRILTEQEAQICHLVREWLCAPDPCSNHNTAQRQAQAGTGRWFLDGPEYTAWFRTPGSRLCLYGGVGSCKTTLMSMVIDETSDLLQGEQDNKMAYFYLAFSDQRKQKYRDLLLSLIYQLQSGRPVVSALRQAYERGGEPSLRILEETFYALVTESRRTYILIDGLDESPDTPNGRQEILEKWHGLVRPLKNLSVFITSRPETDIVDTMNVWGWKQTSVDAGGLYADIRLFVEQQMKTRVGLRRLFKRLPELIGQEVIETLSTKAGGMFRWVALQLDELCKLKTPSASDIRRKMSNLPKDLDETYERILMQIDEAYRETAIMALYWIVFSTRTWTLAEIEVLVLIRPDESGYFDRDALRPVGSVYAILGALVLSEDPPLDDDVNDVSSLDKDDGVDGDQSAEEQAMLDAKRGLDHGAENRSSSSSSSASSRSLKTSRKGSLSEDTYGQYAPRRSKRIRLSHFSVKEYLMSSRIEGTKTVSVFALPPDEAVGNGVLGHWCCAYISHLHQRFDTGFDDDISLDLVNLVGLTAQEKAFFYYARENWEYHFRTAEWSPKLDTKTAAAWIAANGHFAKFLQEEDCPFYDARLPTMAEPAFLAAARDLPKSLKFFLDAGADPNAFDSRGRTPLHVAAGSFSSHAAQVLLSYGADINLTTRSSEAETPLMVAMANHDFDLARLLLEHDCDLTLRNGSDETLLMLALGDWATFDVIIKNARDLDAQDAAGRTVLMRAASATPNRRRAVRQLVEAGASLDIVDYHGETALDYACKFVGPVEYLLCSGSTIAPATTTKYLPGVFYRACMHGSLGLLETLLVSGADPNLRDTKYGSALYEMENHSKKEVWIWHIAEVQNAQAMWEVSDSDHELMAEYEKWKELRPKSSVVERVRDDRELERIISTRYDTMVQLLVDKGGHSLPPLPHSALAVQAGSQIGSRAIGIPHC